MIDFHANTKREFEGSLYGLVINEAARGCSAVIVDSGKLKIKAGQLCRIKVGETGSFGSRNQMDHVGR